MRPIFTAKRSSVLSLLKQGYSHCQIHNRTGVGIGTISRIGRKVDTNKENNPGGRLLPVTSSLFFVKSPLASLIMLFRLPISSIPHSLILFILRLSEMH